VSSTSESTIAEDTLSVSQVARRVDGALRELGDGWIEGEIRAITQHRSGHVYLTLADEDSNLDACIWKGRVKRCLPLPQRGELVQAHYERIDFYAPRGATKLVIDQIKPTGEGELLRRRAETLSRLRADGLCEEDRRKPLRSFPRRVGVIAAQGSDAKVDVIRHLRERMPSQDVIFAPASVQGVEAVGSVIDALGALQSISDVDVIIIARGGGSVADLVAFDDERLCRAIFACSVPVITSIGHTKDRPNCDYVAAAFAPVPAKAAEYAIARSAAELSEEFARHAEQLRSTLVAVRRRREQIADCWARVRPRQRAANLAQDLLNTGELLRSRAQASYHRREVALAGAQREVDLVGVSLPRADTLNELRERLGGAAGQFNEACLRGLDEQAQGLRLGAERIPKPAALEVPAARLQSSGIRTHERLRDYRRAFDRLATDGARDLRRRHSGETRNLNVQIQALTPAAGRSLDRVRERVSHLGALVDAKDLRRRGWVLATDRNGQGIRGVKSLKVGAALGLWFADGEAAVTVDQIRPAEQGEEN
jgi:exodeoxyribonuclease VII large subunit